MSLETKSVDEIDIEQVLMDSLAEEVWKGLIVENPEYKGFKSINEYIIYQIVKEHKGKEEERRSSNAQKAETLIETKG